MKKPHGKDRRRHLDDDEADVWDHAARSVQPLKRAKHRVHASADADEVPERPRPKSPVAHHRGAQGKQAESHTAPGAKPSAAKAIPPIADFDRKKVKRLRAGRTEIDGRIDLHGMRQDEAHGALNAFLHRAQARGWRWVLVITGKGKAAAADHDEPFDMTRDRSRGILKRNVPRWLEEPELRRLVVSFTTAAIEHGGEGALYVHLRKKG